MKNIGYIVTMLLCGVSIMAQNTMRVHYKDGTEQDIFLSHVDSVTFIDKGGQYEEASLIGIWLWGKKGSDYYEVLTFSNDYTYTGYDYYLTYAFDTMIYGWYAQYGNMLTLQSNGFGYQRRYNWFIVSLSANALEVVTKMGGFVYYRVQPEVIMIHVGEQLKCEDGESFVFADGVHVSIENDNLSGKSQGTTYIQKYNSITNTITSHKVIVE